MNTIVLLGGEVNIPWVEDSLSFQGARLWHPPGTQHNPDNQIS